MADIHREGQGAAAWLRLSAARREGLVRWGAHALFWLVYFAFRSGAAAASTDAAPPELIGFPFLANRAIVVAGYFVLTGALLALVLSWRGARVGVMRTLVLIGGALALMPATQVVEQLGPYLLAGIPFESYSLLGYAFQFGWAVLLWATLQALLGYHLEVLAQTQAAARAHALAYDAQLKMLRYQINPHFLFNTLNAISTLVLDKNAEHAESMLLRLSAFLRYSLDRQPTELAPLSAELEAQRKYLEIEQTRFGEKLSVTFNIEPGLDEARLPSLILQPILENAIKYAITPSAEGGRIEVSAFRDGGLLRIRVEDDGPGFEPDAPRQRRGVGLANTQERLTLLFGDRAGLSTHKLQPRGCRIEIWLPMEEHVLARSAAPAPG